ncbi:MAG: glycosyltransferase family 4 protein [Planctomycetota bacterium]
MATNQLRIKHGRRRSDQTVRVSLVSSYVPRRCGIATFARDLAEALAGVGAETSVHAVAVNDRPEGYQYPERVWFEVAQKRLAEYRLAADYLNLSGVDAVVLQHEYGIFGGPDGAYVLEMLRRLRMPVLTTLHTVLKTPTEGQLNVIRELAKVTDRFVVMADRAVEFLHDIYGVPERQVELIPHGIPQVPFTDSSYFKDQFGVEGRKVILTFGLIGPSKGLETMIEALPEIVAQNPDAVYMIVGATHPGVIAHQGEEYRLGLQRRVKELGLTDNVRWINRFMDMEELVEYLGSADVYVTPYLNEAQITSGTLAYAIGTGKAVVSTPYWHAQELLAEGRGRLVPFKDSRAIAAAVNELLGSEVTRTAVRKAAYQWARPMVWPAVADAYLDLIARVRSERDLNPRPVAAGHQHASDSADLPEIKLDHLARLSDGVGVFHGAASTIPLRRGGYTTDDNAQALLAVLMAQDHVEHDAGKRLEDLANRYLAFLEHAFDGDAGRFRFRLDYDRRWAPADEWSEESHGRALWALGEAVARSETRGAMTLAAGLFNRALGAAEGFAHARPKAYALIGVHAYLRRFSGDSRARRVRENVARTLAAQLADRSTNDWPWYADAVTYGAARVPHALLLSGRWMFDDEMISLALKTLEWLVGLSTNEREQFAPAGNKGWHRRDGERARFDQLPIEASAMVDACLEAHRVTAEQAWLDHAQRALNWFLGANELQQPLYDPTTGGCAEALHPHGVSENQPAESTLAWLLSLLALYDHRLDAAAADDPALRSTSRRTQDRKSAQASTA